MELRPNNDFDIFAALTFDLDENIAAETLTKNILAFTWNKLNYLQRSPCRQMIMAEPQTDRPTSDVPKNSSYPTVITGDG